MPLNFDPWIGCHKFSEGCLHCYIYKGALKRGMDFNVIQKNKNFYRLIEKKKDGSYKVPGNNLVYLCFKTDFLLSDADIYRDEVFRIIKERQDLKFLFLTKRIDRFESVMPKDFPLGYDNLVVVCTVENQKNALHRLDIFKKLPIKHKKIAVQPMLEEMSIIDYLDDIEEVVLGGESDKDARPLDYSWVLKIREECIKKNVSFTFRQTGTHFIKEGILYKINPFMQMTQASKANINFIRKK